jgi:hypothetical protein
LSWDDIFKVITGATVSVGMASIIILGLSSWLGKIWASRILQEEKAKLDSLNFEHQIKFSSLHEKRAEIIAETYALVRDVYNEVSNYSSHGGNTHDNLNKVELSLKNLSDYYPKRRIFISYDVAEKIDLFRLELSRIVQEIEVSGPDYYFSSMYDRVRNDASETLSDLEKDFRDLLGEKSTKKSS